MLVAQLLRAPLYCIPNFMVRETRQNLSERYFGLNSVKLVGVEKANGPGVSMWEWLPDALVQHIATLALPRPHCL